jgi:uncharacterized protein YdeI (YjbR/CyaY-like superfamily)
MPATAARKITPKAKSTTEYDPRIDAYIAKCQPFAQPILNHLRELVHKACPTVTESIKWSHAFFEYKGVILANMAGFKEHCSFGFWGKEIAEALREAGYLESGAMGSLGRIASMEDLPPDKELLTLIRQSTIFIDEGKYTSSMARPRVAQPPKPVLEPSPEFAKALKANKQASAVFAKFAPSCKREYVEWISEAKREETRDKRIAQAIEWIAEGKQRNWKYQNC